MLRVRDAIYRNAQYTLITDGMSPDTITQEILEVLGPQISTAVKAADIIKGSTSGYCRQIRRQQRNDWAGEEKGT